MSKTKRIEKIKKNERQKRSFKQTAILAATLTIPILIVIGYHITLIKNQKPLADMPRQQVQVYFYNHESRCLTQELRQVIAHEDLEGRVREIYTQLLEGPVGLSRPILHHHTKLKKVALDERRILTLTFNQSLLKEPMGFQVPFPIRLASIVNTLTANLNQEIAGVVITTESGSLPAGGSPTAPLTWRQDLICPVGNQPAAK